MNAFEIKDKFGLESLTLVQKPEPRPGPGQVLLQMRAWSLNYRDLMVAKGTYNPKLRLPQIPLSDGVGRVAETGPGVTRVKTGDRVAAAFMPKWVCGRVTEDKARSALGGGNDGLLAEYVVLTRRRRRPRARAFDGRGGRDAPVCSSDRLARPRSPKDALPRETPC